MQGSTAHRHGETSRKRHTGTRLELLRRDQKGAVGGCWAVLGAAHNCSDQRGPTLVLAHRTAMDAAIPLCVSPAFGSRSKLQYHTFHQGDTSGRTQDSCRTAARKVIQLTQAQVAANLPGSKLRAKAWQCSATDAKLLRSHTYCSVCDCKFPHLSLTKLEGRNPCWACCKPF